MVLMSKISDLSLLGRDRRCWCGGSEGMHRRWCLRREEPLMGRAKISGKGRFHHSGSRRRHSPVKTRRGLARAASEALDEFPAGLGQLQLTRHLEYNQPIATGHQQPVELLKEPPRLSLNHRVRRIGKHEPGTRAIGRRPGERISFRHHTGSSIDLQAFRDSGEIDPQTVQRLSALLDKRAALRPAAPRLQPMYRPLKYPRIFSPPPSQAMLWKGTFP